MAYACSNSSSTSTETGAAHWTYSGDTGPDNWAGLDPQYEACGGGGGQQSPMECHLVNVAADGSIAVVGVFYNVGAANAVIDAVFGHISSEGGTGGAIHQEGTDIAVTDPVDPSGLLPASRGYYRYAGSLTTPPCSEGLVGTVTHAN